MNVTFCRGVWPLFNCILFPEDLDRFTCIFFPLHFLCQQLPLSLLPFIMIITKDKLTDWEQSHCHPLQSISSHSFAFSRTTKCHSFHKALNKLQNSKVWFWKLHYPIHDKHTWKTVLGNYAWFSKTIGNFQIQSLSSGFTTSHR